MVRKINSNEYLKRYDNMSAVERSAYGDRVGEWLRSGALLLGRRTEESGARFQNVTQASIGWNDSECKAFEDGARLLSALVGVRKDTWLPDLLYGKAVRRTVRNIVACLEDVAGAGEPAGGHAAEEAPVKAPAEEKDAADGHARAGKPAGPAAGRDDARKAAVAAGDVPVRPKHIDQYVHLLPAKTQEHAAKVRDLLRELDNAREKARLLMDSPQASPADRAAWAKKATSCDNAVRSIYRELDAEWEKLVRDGRVTVDDLGNVRVAPGAEPQGMLLEQEAASPAQEQKARRRELRKWLTDTRRGAEGKAREKRVEQWKENWKEYLTLEPLEAALKDEKIAAAAEHFGIDIKTLDAEAGTASARPAAE